MNRGLGKSASWAIRSWAPAGKGCPEAKKETALRRATRSWTEGCWPRRTTWSCFRGGRGFSLERIPAFHGRLRGADGGVKGDEGRVKPEEDDGEERPVSTPAMWQAMLNTSISDHVSLLF